MRLLFFRTVVFSAIVALSAFAASKLDLFGLSSATERTSDEIAQKIFSPFYGHPPFKDQTSSDIAGQDNISVLYLDDQHIHELHRTMEIADWPPSFGDFASILYRLRNVVDASQPSDSSGSPPVLKPAVVFFDFTFNGPLVDLKDRMLCIRAAPDYDSKRCEPWRLVDELAETTKAHEKSTNFPDGWAQNLNCRSTPLAKMRCILLAGGTPVIIGRASPALTSGDTEDRKLTDGFTPYQAELIKVAVISSVTLKRDAYPMMTLYDEGAQPPEGVEGYDLSPAAAMYAAYCLQQHYGCSIKAFAPPQMVPGTTKGSGVEDDEADWPERLKKPLSLVWGAIPAKGQAEMVKLQKANDHCRLANGHASLGDFVSRVGSVLVPQTRDTPADCYYTLNQPYYALGGFLHAEHEKTLIDKRVVIVGAAYRRGTDMIDNPVNGRTPGVFSHAMALDNLFQYGRNYRVAPQEFITKSNCVEAGLLFFLVLVGRNGAIRYRRERRLLSDERRLLGLTFKYLFRLLTISLLLLTAAVFVATLAPPHEPINWLGVFEIALVVGLIELHEPLFEDLAILATRVPVLREAVALIVAISDWLSPEASPEANTAAASPPLPPPA